MAYTVKKLAGLSGVSVRTLHFYDETGLLKPAYVGANGYRFYEKPQLLALQQILFFRELGFELKQIKKILARPDFDIAAALRSHRKVLQKDLSRTRKLIHTIDKTLDHLKGKQPMKDQEMFEGFDPAQQARHEQALIDRLGDGARASIAQSKQRVKDWKKADWANAGGNFVAICQDLTRLMNQSLAADSTEVQKVVRRHFEWLKLFWTPNRESYAVHALIIEESELSKAYETYHPQLPRFLAAAIRIFADKELA